MSAELIKIAHKEQNIGFTQVSELSPGQSLADIAEMYDYQDCVSAWIRSDKYAQWEMVPREEWGDHYPTPSDDPNFMFVFTVHGGKGNNIFRVLATIVVAIVAPYVLAAYGTVAAAVFVTAGNYAIGQLFPPETAGLGPKEGQESDSYSRVTSDSNTLVRAAFYPRVIGTRRIVPPETCEPRFSMKKGIQTLERQFAMYGKTWIREPWADGSPMDDFDAIEYEIKDGDENTTTYSSLVDKISAFTDISTTLKSFDLDGDDLVDEITVSNSEPQPVRIVSESHPRTEEINIRTTLANFIKTSDDSDKVMVPFRLRMREKGETAWRNLPEVHFVGRSTQTEIIEFRFRWDTLFGGSEIPGTIKYDFWPYVGATTLTDSTGSSGPMWECDPYFSDGTLVNEVVNVEGVRGSVRITLDETFDKTKQWEFEIIRGLSMTKSNIDNDYRYNGVHRYNLFHGTLLSGKYQVPKNQDTFPVAININHITTIADEIPCQTPGTALLSMRSTGKTIRNVSCLASGYIMDWNGVDAWDVETTSNNPASWYYNILKEWLDIAGVDLSLIDQDSIIAWRQECIDKGYTVSMVAAGERTSDVLSICTAAGFARPVYENGFGVDWFRDRSGETPVCILSPRNTKSTNISISEIESPSSRRISFQNEEKDYADDEISVPNPTPVNFLGEQADTVTGQANADLIFQHEILGFLERHHRKRIWTVEMFVEHIGFTIGDIVGVATNLFADETVGARVTTVIDPYTIVIDDSANDENNNGMFDIDNLFEVDNLYNAGEETVAFFTTPDGTEMHTVGFVEGRIVRLLDKLENTDVQGSHVVIGPKSRFIHRCIVRNIDPDEDNNATVTLVDEASVIYDEMHRRFYR